MSTPQSTIRIYSGVRLDNRYEHTIFLSRTEPESIFTTLSIT